MAGQQNKVVTKQNFKVSISGSQSENFISVSDITMTAEIIDDVGGADKTGRKVPGKKKFEPITLVRSYQAGDKLLKQWANKNESKDVSIIFCDIEGKDVERFNLQQAKVSSYSVSGLSSQDGSMATETVVVTFENGEWAQ